jgi:hypothetical protein
MSIRNCIKCSEPLTDIEAVTCFKCIKQWQETFNTETELELIDEIQWCLKNNQEITELEKLLRLVSA